MPLQFLVQVYTSSSSCTVGKLSWNHSSNYIYIISRIINIGPTYTGLRPSGACVGVDINQTVVEVATFSVGCSGVTLADVITSSPNGI